jgi:hypothetical protein
VNRLSILRWKARLRCIDELVCFGDRGIGDDLLCTAVLHEMHRRGRTRVAMMTAWPELFENLPAPAMTVPYRRRALKHIERAGVTVRCPRYSTVVHEDPLRYAFPPGHFIESMCRSVGIEGPVEARPRIRLTAAETSRWAHLRGSLVVQTSRANPRFAAPNKEWYAPHWQDLAVRLRGVAKIVQIGSRGDPPFDGAADFRGETSLRDAAAILCNARLFLGLEGFLMHLARAVDTRAVILFGGYVHPSTSGYPENTNLFAALPCSPCGQPVHCSHDRACMRRITPEAVAAAVDAAWEMPALARGVS